MSWNSNQKESIAGQAMLALKLNSTKPEIVGAFVALTSFASNTRPLWRPDNDHFTSINAVTLKEFSQKIHLTYKIPSMQLTQWSQTTSILADAIMMHQPIWKIILMLSVSHLSK
jgi:hypothetical protein